MSKAKDRARAESGLIFRDGGLVKKEDWYAAHPTREMLKERQAGVDKAVSEMMLAKQQGLLVVQDGKVLDPKDTSAVIAETEPYFCTKCNIVHRRGKVFTEHHQHASKVVVV